MLGIEIQRWPISDYTIMCPTYIKIYGDVVYLKHNHKANLEGGRHGRERKITLTKVVCFLPQDELKPTSDHHKRSKAFRILNVFV